jgi:hypothetical protein
VPCGPATALVLALTLLGIRKLLIGMVIFPAVVPLPATPPLTSALGFFFFFSAESG